MLGNSVCWESGQKNVGITWGRGTWAVQSGDSGLTPSSFVRAHPRVPGVLLNLHMLRSPDLENRRDHNQQHAGWFQASNEIMNGIN